MTLPRSAGARILLCVLFALGAAGLLLCFGGYLLVASDALPKHVQVAVVLTGSADGAAARRAEAMRLLREGLADQVMMSVNQFGFWGQRVPDVARHYLEDKYGPSATGQVAFCELSGKEDSTAEEAVVLRRCLEERGWRSVLVITSNYHTRRARMVWRKALANAQPPFSLWVAGVADGDFQPRGWWQKRRFAKTWLLEFTKLTWTFFGGG